MEIKWNMIGTTPTWGCSWRCSWECSWGYSCGYFDGEPNPHVCWDINLLYTDRHTWNLIFYKMFTPHTWNPPKKPSHLEPFRCQRFLLWEPHQPTVRFAQTIFLSQHNLLSFQFSRSLSATLANSNRHSLRKNVQCEIEKNGNIKPCVPKLNLTHIYMYNIQVGC
jgi:hypothetical protein